MPAYLPELDVEGLARHVEQSYRPGLGAYLGANASLAFDTTTTGIALAAAERAGADAGRRLSEAEWRASPYWRQDLAYDPDTTEGLAEVRARQRDERKWTNELIARRDAGAFETVLGFGAGLVGSIPDPINFVPLVGPAWRAAVVARAATRAAFVARSAMVGAVEGGVATTLLTPLIMHESKYIGDEMSWADAGLNVAIGAALSGVVGGAGGAFASRGGRVWSREGLDLAANERTRAVDAQADTTIAASQVAQGQDVDLGPGHRSRTVDAPEPDAPLPPGFSRADPADPAGVPRWVEGALKARDNKQRLVLGPASEATVRAVREGAGIEIGGYAHILETSGVLHVDKKHGPNGPEAKNGGIPVRSEDYAEVKGVLDAPDTVRSTTTDRGFDGIWYEKRMPDGYWYYVEAIRTGRKTLALETFYKRPNRHPDFRAGSGGSPPPRLPDAYGEPPPGRTSETSAVSADSPPRASESLDPDGPRKRPEPRSARPDDQGAPPERPEQAPPAVRELVPATGPYDRATARPAFDPLEPPEPDPPPRPLRPSDEERARVRTDFTAMLHRAGRPRELATAEAAVLEAGFTSFAEARGVPVETLIDRYLRDIRAAKAPTADAGDAPTASPEAAIGRTKRSEGTGGTKPDLEAELGALLRRSGLSPERQAVIRAALEDAPADQSGKTSTVVMPDGTAIEARLEVVELDDLIASHDESMGINPDFPPELQPRDRTRAASAEQVAALAAKLDPRLLGETPTPGEGAPIVGPEGVVESGNGRTLALRRAYGQGMASAKRYRQYLADRGHRVEGMKQPVLVRRRTTELTPERRVAFTRQANEATVARPPGPPGPGPSGRMDGYRPSMGAAEQAAGDAERLGTDVLDLVRAPDLQAAANRPFVRAFIDALPASERAGLMAADGSLARAGAARIEAALLARAYGDDERGLRAPFHLTARLVESADDELGPLGKALADAAPGVARLKAGIEAGSTAAEGDPVPGLLDAVRAVVQAREAKQPLDFPLMQQDMLGGGLGAEGRAWLGAMLHRTKAGVRLKGRQRLAELLDGVVGEAGKRAPGADMFGARPAKAGAILDAVTARQGQALRRETLFQGKKPVAVLKGDELGVDPSDDSKVLRKAAREVYRRLQDPKNRTMHPTLGPIRYTRKGWDELAKTGADSRKWRLIPALDRIIAGADHVATNALTKPRDDGVVQFHWLEATVDLAGERLRVGIQIGEDADGNRFFNLNQDLDTWSAKYATPGRSGFNSGNQTPRGPKRLTQQARPSTDGINLHLLDGAPGDAPRGAITLHEDGRAVIELFETADASTVVHEAAHLFTGMMQDLAPHDAGIAADLKIVKDWTGAGDGPLLPAHHEKIATAFEAWVEGGAAPSGLEAAFRTLATFMARLFDGFRAQGRRATPEVEAVFERMLSVRPEARPKPDPAPADPAMASYDRLVREGRAHPDDIAEVEAWEREIARMGDLDAAYAQAAACVIAGLGAAA